MAPPKLKSIGIHAIEVDAGTQSRAMINETVVGEYAEAWLAGAEFPPLDVFQGPDGTMCLADGFHRLLAAKIVRKTTVTCRVFSGNSRDAFLYACGANGTHGLRRTNADKRHMVEVLLSDREWASWTDSRIADVCGVSHNLVAAVRRDLQKILNSPAALVRDAVRKGADGKVYPPKRKRRSVDPPVRPSDFDSADKSNTDTRREKALTAVKELSKLLQVIGIYDDHATALKAITRQLKERSFRASSLLPSIAVMDGSMSSALPGVL